MDSSGRISLRSREALFREIFDGKVGALVNAWLLRDAEAARLLDAGGGEEEEDEVEAMFARICLDEEDICIACKTLLSEKHQLRRKPAAITRLLVLFLKRPEICEAIPGLFGHIQELEAPIMDAEDAQASALLVLRGLLAAGSKGTVAELAARAIWEGTWDAERSHFEDPARMHLVAETKQWCLDNGCAASWQQKPLYSAGASSYAPNLMPVYFMPYYMPPPSAAATAPPQAIPTTPEMLALHPGFAATSDFNEFALPASNFPVQAA